MRIDGDQAKLQQVVACLDSFEFWFNSATPPPRCGACDLLESHPSAASFSAGS
jgi:hypothetical protein